MSFNATQFKKAHLTIIAAVLLLVYLLHDKVSQPPLFAWALLVLAVALWRGFLSRAISAGAPGASTAQLQRYESLVLASTVLSSFSMGTAFWLVGLHSDLYVKLVVTLISMIHMLGMLVYTAPDISRRMLRIGGNVGQGILFWSGVGSSAPPQWEVLIAYSAVVWLGFVFSREHLRHFRESLRIRHENAALLLQLEEEKKIVETALREAKLANDSKSRFLAAASHDLRQPLHALTMFLGTLTFHVTTDDAKRLLGRIKETVNVLEEQFNSLLDLSRFDVGAVVPEIKLFRLDSSVERLIDELRPMAEAKNLEITLEINAGLCPAIAKSDPMLYGRLLRNLLDNAVKYTQSGSIVVRVTEQSQAFLVEVIDTGPGIPADQQIRIFDEYVQLTNPARQRRHGVGLGLAIVKRIDLLLGMNLRLQSDEGVGSQFSFLIPAAVDDANPQTHQPLLSSTSNSTNFKTSASIWILDDDSVALESLQGQLSAWGAHVTTFSRPEDLLAELRTGTPLPHWICTDDMLGTSLSGLETAQLLSRQFGFGKVCLITGNTEPMRLMELRSSGFPVIVKPAKPENLMAIIGN